MILFADRRINTTPPPMLPAPDAWFAADTGVFKDSAGTQSCIDGDIISRWLDKSGNGRDAILTDSRFPGHFKTNIVNGKPVFRSNNDPGSMLQLPSMAVQTIFAVVKYNSATFTDYSGIIGGVSFQLVNGSQGVTNLDNGASAFQAAYKNGIARSLPDIPGNVGNDFYPLNDQFWLGTFILSTPRTQAQQIAFTSNLPNRCWNGDIAELKLFSGVLSSADRQAIEQDLIARYSLVNSYNPAVQNAYRFEGDSITVGQGISAPNGSYPAQVLLGLGRHLDFSNFAVSGSTTAQVLARQSAVMATYSSLRPKNFLLLFIGTNNFSAGTNSTAVAVYNDIVTYCQAAQAKGFIVLTATPLDRGDPSKVADFETRRQDLRTMMINGQSTFCSAIIDATVDSILGVQGASDNTTYFQGDKVHPTAAGAAHLAQLFLAGLAGL